MSQPRKYSLLRVIATILKVLGVLALAAGLIVAIVSAFGAGAGILAVVKTMGLVIGPLVGIVWFVQLYAFGSILSLLIDIEENTRVLAAQPTAGTAPVDLA